MRYLFLLLFVAGCSCGANDIPAEVRGPNGYVGRMICQRVPNGQADMIRCENDEAVCYIAWQHSMECHFKDKK